MDGAVILPGLCFCALYPMQNRDYCVRLLLPPGKYCKDKQMRLKNLKHHMFREDLCCLLDCPAQEI